MLGHWMYKSLGLGFQSHFLSLITVWAGKKVSSVRVTIELYLSQFKKTLSLNFSYIFTHVITSFQITLRVLETKRSWFVFPAYHFWNSLVASENKFPVSDVFAQTTLSTDNLICSREDLEVGGVHFSRALPGLVGQKYTGSLWARWVT